MPVMEGWRKKAIVGVKETMSGWEMVEDHEERDDIKLFEVLHTSNYGLLMELIDCDEETGKL